MKKVLYPLIALSFLLSSCSSSTDKDSQQLNNTEQAVAVPDNAIVFEYEENAPEEIKEVMEIIREEYNQITRFVNEPQVIEQTNVPGRIKIIGKFLLIDRGEEIPTYYSIYLQKINNKWEYGTLLISKSQNPTLSNAFVVRKGRMKEVAENEGIGDKIIAGGFEFIIAEKKPTAIRVYTDSKLSNNELKVAIKDLMNIYDPIMFATTDKHNRGDEYASWSGGIFFNFDNDEIIPKEKFFK